MWRNNPLSESRNRFFRKLISDYYLRSLRAPRGSLTLHEEKIGPLNLRISQKEDSIQFTGSPTGGHSLDVSASTKARIDAHWEGYCETASRFLDRLPEKVDRAIDFLNKADPSTSGKYSAWLFKLYTSHHGTPIEDDITELNELLIEFELKKHRLPIQFRDINTYTTSGELSRTLREQFRESKRGRRKRLEGAGLDLIYHDDDYEIIKI